MLNFVTMTLQNQALKDVFYYAGCYFAAKTSLNFLLSVYSGLKTFLLPNIWPRNFVKEYGEWAIVTGCSKGIGLSYAHELAKRGLNLILIARKADLLHKIAQDITDKHNVKVEVIIADFGQATESTFTNIEDSISGKDIGILVNNVGVAYEGLTYFHELSASKMQNMIQVNTSTMTLMTKMVLPMLETKKKGAIINISSICGFGPQPFMTLYSATKAFVDFFTRGLAYEYDEKGITIQCVYPGPVNTDMLNNVLKKDTPHMVKSAMPDPDTFAAQAVKTLGFASCTTGFWSHGLMTSTGMIENTWLSKLNNQKHLVNKKD